MNTTPVPRPEAEDPSMEDILASIRRILDEEAPAVSVEPAVLPEVAPAGPAAPGGREEPPVLELDHSMLLPEPELAPGGPVPVPPVRPEPIPAPPAPPVAEPVPMPDAALVAPAAAAAAASSVGSLLKTLASERGTAVSRGGPTIEDMVRDEIRPLLKEWLDAHLAPMVERLVRAEIERVISRS